MIEFVKAHGIGNDFVVIPDLDGRIQISPEAVRQLCDRRFGIGADAVIRIAPGERAAWMMDYRNNDGSLAEMCGNGVRVVGKWLGDRGHVPDMFDLDTRAGVKHLMMDRSTDTGKIETVVVDMGEPRYTDKPTEVLTIGDQSLVISTVSVGNPHAVMFVDDVDAVAFDVLGPLIQAQNERFPEGVNVEIAAVQADGTIRERTYERGVGETLACGTGASAVAVAAQRRGLAGERITMDLRGGRLLLEWSEGGPVYMTGPAVEVFTGVFDPHQFGITLQ